SVLSFLEQKQLFSYKNSNALIRELFLTANPNKEKIMAWLMPFHAFQKELNNHRLYTVEMIKNNISVFFVIMDFMKSEKPSIFYQILQNFLKKIIEEENKDQFLFEEIYFKYKKDI